MSDADWIIREYNPEWDTGCLLSMWLGSYAKSDYGRSVGADRGGVEDKFGYWWEHRRHVLDLLDRCGARVMCDPERPEPVGDKPAIIWAWACVDPEQLEIHYVSIKRHVAKLFAEDTSELWAALVGDLVNEPCRVTHELTEMRSAPWRKAKIAMPPGWYLDEHVHGTNAA